MTELSSNQQWAAIVAVILLLLFALAIFGLKVKKSRSPAHAARSDEIVIDTVERAKDLQIEIDGACRRNLRLGRQTHGLYLALGVLIVGSSALSAILALGFERVDRRLIGAIALIPGICAGVADRFHLVLKKHWYYRKYDRLKALSRRMHFIIPPVVTEVEITKAATDLCKIDREMSRAWEQLEEEHPPAQPEGKKQASPTGH
jgi:hypothetical protein